ncbi:MAG: DUF3025 domain-containing protein [Limnobacter sp.]|nr:DUF3025 domain-containing protein [Limnobacter sp.]
MKPWLGPLWPHDSPFPWPEGFVGGACAAQLELLRLSLSTSVAKPEGVSSDISPAIIKRFEFSDANMKALEYERHVAGGGIPTRDQFHDWFNGLVWLTYPRTKLAINHLHVNDGFTEHFKQRSPLRDAITLWDESGAVLLTSDPSLESALREHDWQHVFIGLRAQWGENILPFCFGHGLLDAMRNPHKGLCAKVKVVQADQALLDKVLNPLAISSVLDGVFLSIVQQLRSPRDLNPLPVMGVPGWFEENRAPGFYDDEAVFRKKPTRRASL